MTYEPAPINFKKEEFRKFSFQHDLSDHISRNLQRISINQTEQSET